MHAPKDSGSAKAASARKLIASAMRSADVPFAARGLYVLLAGYANADGSNCYPSMETLAHASGLNLKSVVTHLKALRDAGWVSSTTRKTKRGRVNLYTLHWGNIGPEAERRVDPKNG
jgi:hypothetical protein